MATVLDPKGFSRIGLIRRLWHLRVLHHSVAGSIVRDVRTWKQNRRIEFYYRRGWVCMECKALWP